LCRDFIYSIVYFGDEAGELAAFSGESSSKKAIAKARNPLGVILRFKSLPLFKIP
jgi:hypothetical protein